MEIVSDRIFEEFIYINLFEFIVRLLYNYILSLLIFLVWMIK